MNFKKSVEVEDSNVSTSLVYYHICSRKISVRPIVFRFIGIPLPSLKSIFRIWICELYIRHMLNKSSLVVFEKKILQFSEFKARAAHKEKVRKRKWKSKAFRKPLQWRIFIYKWGKIRRGILWWVPSRHFDAERLTLLTDVTQSLVTWFYPDRISFFSQKTWTNPGI